MGNERWFLAEKRANRGPFIFFDDWRPFPVRHIDRFFLFFLHFYAQSRWWKSLMTASILPISFKKRILITLPPSSIFASPILILSWLDRLFFFSHWNRRKKEKNRFHRVPLVFLIKITKNGAWNVLEEKDESTLFRIDNQLSVSMGRGWKKSGFKVKSTANIEDWSPVDCHLFSIKIWDERGYRKWNIST